MLCIPIIIAVFVVAIACLYGFEQRDKDRREREGLPPRKYHDATDSDDVHVYYSIHDK